MAIQDRQINPDSFYEKETEFTSFTLENDLASMRSEMRKIEHRVMVIDNFIEKELKKLEVIKNSNAIPYQVAGGYFEKQNDLLQCEYYIARMNQSLDANHKKWEDLEKMVEEYEAKLDNM